MNIQRIELTNYGSWESLDLPIEPGVTLISGSNGAGKSTILSAAEFALFGATSDAGRLIRRGTDEARVRVTVEVAAGVVFIERTIRLNGARATVGLTLHAFAETTLTVEPITAATVTETQAIIDRLLGVTRETLRASALSMQGDGAAFCEAKPADRKRVLLAALPSMELWPMLHDTAKAEKRTADDAANVARAELERLDGARERSLQATVAMGTAGAALAHAWTAEGKAEAEAEQLAAEAEAAREARRQHAAAAEAEQRARADHERAGVERQAAEEALARAKAAAANAPSVEDARIASAQAATDLELAEHAHEVAERVERNHCEQLVEAQRMLAASQQERDRADADHERLSQRLAHAQSNACPECGQELVTPDARAIVERIGTEHAAAERALIEGNDAMTSWRNREHYLLKHTPAASFETLPALVTARSAAQAAATALAEAQTIQSLAGSIDAAQQRARDAMDRQAETADALRVANRAHDELRKQREAQGLRGEIDYEGSHQAALSALSEARAAHSAAAAELARAEEAAKLAERQAAEETAARERLEAATREAAVAKVLCDGFGPAGCPAMIVDSVLGDLADEANRVLAELSSPIRVDLRSQRVTQKGDVVDALEIVVSMNAMEASYETLSGGERTRVALALRAALTRLLASKRGARVRLLVVDEPQGLDASGSEAFADVLGEFVRAGIFESCIVVTHDDRLADRIDRVIRVEKDSAGVSRLVGAAVEVPA